MEVIKYPSREEWASLAQRPALDVTTLFDTVRTVLDEVRKGGDAAVIRYEEKFDKIDPATFKRLQVSEQELAEAKELVPEELKQAIRQAKNNIEIFHASQRFTGKKVETTPGVTCWQKAVAIEKVGLYIPGGTAPLFSTVLPAVRKSCFVRLRAGMERYTPPSCLPRKRQASARYSRQEVSRP